MKICPKCNEMVADGSLVCKGCQTVFHSEEQAPSHIAVSPLPGSDYAWDTPETLLARAKGELRKGNLHKASGLHSRALHMSGSDKQILRMVEQDARMLIENAETADTYIQAITSTKPAGRLSALVITGVWIALAVGLILNVTVTLGVMVVVGIIIALLSISKNNRAERFALSTFRSNKASIVCILAATLFLPCTFGLAAAGYFQYIWIPFVLALCVMIWQMALLDD